MRFTDIFIRRPVLATVISLLIAIAGIIAARNLPLRQFPEISFSNITISTSFPGASAEAMQSMVTNWIQNTVSSADDIDYIESSSSEGSSRVTVTLLPGTDVDAAITQITAKVQSIKDELPNDASFQDPVIQKSNAASGGGLMFIAFSSDKMTSEQISYYVSQVVAKKLTAIPGVAGAGSMGARTYAMRIWLDPTLMAAKNITVPQIQAALLADNIVGSAGIIEGKNDYVSIEAETGLSSAKEFNNVVVRKDANGDLVRVKDIGYAQLGASSYNSSVLADGKPAVVVKITTKAEANPLSVAKAVKKILPKIKADLPATMHAQIVYDKSRFIQQSVNTVAETILEAAVIVMVVIFLCLGSLRAVFIPIVTIPLSLVGVFAVMMACGFSFNVLTLLALVLAIGLVVDDAIVVSENITRHLEHGVPPLQAALFGAREIATPVITMTLTLAAVFLPVGLAGGLTGVLFSEFAYTLAGAVLISGIISLTLSPMMCFRVLSLKQLERPFVKWVNTRFERLKAHYQRLLLSVLEARSVIIFAAVAILISCFFLYITTASELAPDEDHGSIFASGTAPSRANVTFTDRYMKQIEALTKKIPEAENSTVITNRNSGNLVILLKPREQRKRSAAQIEEQLTQEFKQIPGLMTEIQHQSTLPGIGELGDPLQFALVTADPNLQSLVSVSKEIQRRAEASHMFDSVTIQLKLDTPLWEVSIDTSKAAQMGITSQQILTALSGVLSGGKVNYFRMAGNSYSVIPQVMDQYRMTPEILKTLNVQTDSGEMVPLGNFIHLRRVVKATTLNQFQRLNSTFVNASMAHGYSLSDGLKFMIATAKQVMPAGMSYDLGGEARQLVQEGNRILITFIFALIVIFLVLAAQFESFRDPLIIMMSVPLSLFGALIPLNIGLGTINLFTQIGFLTLIGLISKHGILIVQFANKLQETEGLGIKDAVVKAAALRLRPILMTTAAMIFGVLPLIFAKTGLANSQRDIALVIFFGMLIGTCFTLFVVPTVYTYLAKKRIPQ